MAAQRQRSQAPEGCGALFASCARYASAEGPTYFDADGAGPRIRWYIRVSTPQQAKDETHEAQVHLAQERAMAEGWGQLLLYVEPGVSGETLDGRPVMRQLLADVLADPGDAVAAKALDRLCRSQSLGPWGTIAETFKQARIEVIAQGLRLDLHDPTQALMFTMVGPGFAGFEKALIMGRFKDGQRRAARADRKPSWGTPWPLAYDREHKAWSIPDDRRKTARRLVDLALDDRTHTEIAAILNAEGLPSPTGKPWNDRLVSNRLQAKQGTSVLCGEWVLPSMDAVIRVPAVCTKEEFLRVRQSIDARRAAPSGRPSDGDVLFRGLGWCGVCQRRLHVVRQGSGGAKLYYKCGSRTYWARKRGIKSCDTPSVPAPAADEALWALIRQLLEEPALLADACADESSEAEERALGAEAESLSNRLARLESGRRTLAKQIALGMLDDKDADEALVAHKATRTLVERRLQEIEDYLGRRAGHAEQAEALVASVDRLRGRLDAATYKDRRALVEAICPNRLEHGLMLCAGRRLVLRGALAVPGITSLRDNGRETPTPPSDARRRTGVWSGQPGSTLAFSLR
jgi:DNA invertase Pin-like site-specific DNA recombinase